MLLLTVLRAVFLPLTSSMCPQPTLWPTAAARKCPTPSHYHCLMNEAGNLYEEFCFPPEKYPSGSYVVYDGGLTSKICPSARYQPKAFYSSEFYECVYSKSMCNNDGQIIHRDGTKEKDRSCRCDYTKGYDYVTIPENRCYCFPDKEDCSCYLKPCPNGTHGLTPDYECSQSGNLISCPFRHISSTIPSTTVNTPHREPKYDDKSYNVLLLKGKAGLYTLTAIILVPIVCGIMLMLYLSIRYIKMRHLSSIEVSATIEIRRMAMDPFIVIPSFFDDLLHTIQNKPVLILKGREGTGKTTLALKLASTFLKEDYQCVLLNRSDLSSGLFYPHSKSLIIIDNPLGDNADNDSFSKLKKQLSIILKHTSATKLILTINTLNSDIQEVLNIEHIKINDIMHDIRYDEHDKLAILRTYRRKFETSKVSDTNMDDEIVKIEPVLGFPTTCVMFCSNINDYNKIGVEYFNQPPPSIVRHINKLRESGESNRSKRNEYIVLAYVMMAPNCKLIVQNIDIKLWKTIQNQVFYIKTKIRLQDIIDAANRLVPQFLCYEEKTEFRFCHEAILKAVMMSYGSVAPADVIPKCDIRHLLALLRRNLYEPEYGQPFLLSITKNEPEQHILAQHLTSNIFNDEAIASCYGIFMNDFVIAQKNAKLLSVVFKIIQKLAKQKPELLMSVCIFFQGLTDLPNEYLFCRLTTDNFAYVWRYVSVKVSRNDQRLRENREMEINTEVFNTIVDNYGNTLLHYFVLWDSKNEIFILYQLQRRLAEKSKKSEVLLDNFNASLCNKNKHSALSFAGYLGKAAIFVTLVRIMKLKEDSSFLFKAKTKLVSFLTDLPIYVEQGKRHASEPLQDVDDIIKVDWRLLQNTVLFGTKTDFTSILDEIESKT